MHPLDPPVSTYPFVCRRIQATTSVRSKWARLSIPIEFNRRAMLRRKLRHGRGRCRWIPLIFHGCRPSSTHISNWLRLQRTMQLAPIQRAIAEHILTNRNRRLQSTLRAAFDRPLSLKRRAPLFNIHKGSRVVSRNQRTTGIPPLHNLLSPLQLGVSMLEALPFPVHLQDTGHRGLPILDT